MRQTYRTAEESYHDVHADWYAKRNRTDYIWQVPEELSILTPRFIGSDEVIVDMGCGPAASFRQFFRRFGIAKRKYIGVDVSQRMLALAKQAIPQGTYLHADAETVRLAAPRPTCIVSLGALHHCKNQQKAIAHWYSLLQKEGKILLREPYRHALPAGTGESPQEKGIEYHELMATVRHLGGRVLFYQPFSTRAFHLFNRLLIFLRLGGWSKCKALWYPVTYVDFFLSRYTRFFPLCKGTAFLMVIEKP